MVYRLPNGFGTEVPLNKLVYHLTVLELLYTMQIYAKRPSALKESESKIGPHVPGV